MVGPVTACATLALVSPARRDPAPGERSTPDALMDAALDQPVSRARAVSARMLDPLAATSDDEATRTR